MGRKVDGKTRSPVIIVSVRRNDCGVWVAALQFQPLSAWRAAERAAMWAAALRLRLLVCSAGCGPCRCAGCGPAGAAADPVTHVVGQLPAHAGRWADMFSACPSISLRRQGSMRECRTRCRPRLRDPPRRGGGGLESRLRAHFHGAGRPGVGSVPGVAVPYRSFRDAKAMVGESLSFRPTRMRPSQPEIRPCSPGC